MKRHAFLFVALFLAAVFDFAHAGVVTVPAGQTYAAQCADDLVLLGNGSNVTLPDATACVGKRIVLKKGDQTSGISVISAQAGQTVEHSPNLKLQITGDGMAVVSDGTRWHTEVQYSKHRPYSHRTVSYASTNGGGWALDICRDDAELVRVWANESPGGIGIYLPAPSSGCVSGNPYIRTGVVWIQNVSTDLSKPVSVWPSSGTTINGAYDPVFLKARYETIMLYTDGNEWFVIGYTHPNWPARSW